MPKRTDLKKIMIIGSGPIVIGQAAEQGFADGGGVGGQPVTDPGDHADSLGGILLANI